MLDNRPVPEHLIYEIMDSKPIYYRGYESVIAGDKTKEDIMGSSILQALLIACIQEFLWENVDRKTYQVLSNELGLHINKSDNLATDLAIYKKEQLRNIQQKDKYAHTPPQIVFEIDTKANFNNFDETMNYINLKTNKLFNFGVEKVYWILSASHKIIEATPQESWRMIDWTEKVEPLEGISFTLSELMEENGSFF